MIVCKRFTIAFFGHGFSREMAAYKSAYLVIFFKKRISNQSLLTFEY